MVTLCYPCTPEHYMSAALSIWWCLCFFHWLLEATSTLIAMVTHSSLTNFWHMNALHLICASAYHHDSKLITGNMHPQR